MSQPGWDLPIYGKAATGAAARGLKNHRADYESLLIFAYQAELPRPVLARLSNVGGEQIASLDARDDIERKILRKVA